MKNTDPKILSKIKKCLALGESPEPQEAASAMRQAQKMMDKYNVSMGEINRPSIGESSIKSKVSVSVVKPWELRLVSLIAKAFGCKIMWTSSTSYSKDVYGKYTFIGIDTQVMLAQYAGEVLLRKLFSSRTKFVKGLPKTASRKWKIVQADGFCSGWVTSISAKVDEFALNGETSTAITERFQELAGGGRAKCRSRREGYHGRAAGVEAGSKESFHRPMSTTNRTGNKAISST
jgi:hypothetical protein